jgi:hypothetical protein
MRVAGYPKRGYSSERPDIDLSAKLFVCSFRGRFWSEVIPGYFTFLEKELTCWNNFN